MAWRITYYETPAGNSPVYFFIEGLPYLTKSRVYNTLELLSEFGTSLRKPHVKKLAGTPLWELRVLGSASTRIFYMAEYGQQFLLLHGFQKKTEKTPKREIKTALQRLRDYQKK